MPQYTGPEKLLIIDLRVLQTVKVYPNRTDIHKFRCVCDERRSCHRGPDGVCSRLCRREKTPTGRSRGPH